ncbi:g928 [Coccomyxa elongata]
MAVLTSRPLPTDTLPRHVFSIRFRDTYFGLHAPIQNSPDVSETHILAFAELAHAQRFSSALLEHKAREDTWPDRIVGPDHVMALESGPLTVVNCLNIKQEDIVDVMRICSLGGMCMSVVDDMVEKRDSGFSFAHRLVRAELKLSEYAARLEYLHGIEPTDGSRAAPP